MRLLIVTVVSCNSRFITSSSDYETTLRTPNKGFGASRKLIDEILDHILSTTLSVSGTASGLQRGSPRTHRGRPRRIKKSVAFDGLGGDTSWRAAHLASKHTLPGLAQYTKELDSSETEVLHIDCFEVR